MFGPLLREFSNEYVRIFFNFFLFTFHSYFSTFQSNLKTEGTRSRKSPVHHKLLIPLSCFFISPFREVPDHVWTYPTTVWTVINDKSHQILLANSFPMLKLPTIRTSIHPESVSQERLSRKERLTIQRAPRDAPRFFGN